MLRRSLAALIVFATLVAPSLAADKVRFGTNWVAEAEHGGFYQALADGTYAKFGLEVEIVPGGPQINNRILLSAGKLDFYISANFLQAFAAVDRNILQPPQREREKWQSRPRRRPNGRAR